MKNAKSRLVSSFLMFFNPEKNINEFIQLKTLFSRDYVSTKLSSHLID